MPAPSASDLARAQQLAANERHLVDAQRRLITSLAAQGRDIAAAKNLLQEMLATLASLEERRDRIKAAVVANLNSK